MWIFQYKELVAGLIISVLLTVPYYFVLRSEKFRISKRRHVSIFFVFWAAAYSLEYYIFGPSSYISMESDGRWEYLRKNNLALRVLDDYDAIVDACCTAWNDLLAIPDRIASITKRKWATVS